MNEFIELLEGFWFLRDNGSSDYFRIKRGVTAEMKRFIGEFPGWKLIANSKLIKLEKIPAEAEPFMGIQSFEDTKDYCLLCALLIFLDDIDDGGQFILSELIEAIEKIVSDVIEIDLTLFTDRKALVRVLRFAQNMGFMKIAEGSLNNLENDRKKEILYENTGVSGFFSVHHDNDISDYSSFRDFENTDSIYSDNDRGVYRTNRVYRRLMIQPAMYWDSKDNPDSIYLKNQRNSISNHLEEYMGGRLDIHNDSAFYMLNEEMLFGNIHPSDKTLSGLVLFLCSEIRENISDLCGAPRNKYYEIEKEKFHSFICACRKKYIKGFSKEYREITDNKLVLSAVKYMKDWKMIEEKSDAYILRDGIFKTSGKYPKDFSFMSDKEENDNGTLDNEQAGIC